MRFKRVFVLFMALILVLSLAACGKNAPTATPGPESAPTQQTDRIDEQKATLFVNADWLKANLEKTVVIDVRTDKEYADGHIPGAVNAVWQTFANVKGKPGDPAWGTLLPKEELAAAIGKLGVNGDKMAVVYGQPPGWGEEGRVLWTFNVAGIKNVKILDGGLSAWKNAGGAINNAQVSPIPVTFSISALDEQINATQDWIVANQKNIKIVDVRTDKEWAGATDFGEARGGHLPGAIHLAFEEMFNNDGTLKSSQELKALFTGAGLKTDDTIVTYCTKGIRSGHMAMVLKMVGFEKARNYDASFYEWSGNKNLPLEK
ncbi:MAG: rhodanese-like domain-containing protein [Dehalobacter sp.]|nr:rhodanese-like domain-containing protein [Dehalobacter sp.]